MTLGRKGPAIARKTPPAPPRPAPAQPQSWRDRLPDGSKSVQSPFVWRLFAFMSLIALGIFIMCLAGGEPVYAGCWALITVGWFTTSMWLWRKHIKADDAAWEARKRRGQVA